MQQNAGASMKKSRKKIKDLEQKADNFDKAIKIRALLGELSRAGKAKDPAWMEWAHNYADSIDPLMEAGEEETNEPSEVGDEC